MASPPPRVARSLVRSTPRASRAFTLAPAGQQSNVIVFISEIKYLYLSGKPRGHGHGDPSSRGVPRGRHLRRLETSLGVKLFERGKHGFALSAAGRAFRPHAEQLLQTVALARQAVHDLRPAAGGALQIAAVLSICTYLLPDVLKRFHTAYPKVLITVRSGHSKEVLEMVLRAEAEIGLARSVHHPEVETLSLRDDPLILVARPAAWPGRARRARLEE